MFPSPLYHHQPSLPLGVARLGEEGWGRLGRFQKTGCGGVYNVVQPVESILKYYTLICESLAAIEQCRGSLARNILSVSRIVRNLTRNRRKELQLATWCAVPMNLDSFPFGWAVRSALGSQARFGLSLGHVLYLSASKFWLVHWT